MKSIRRRERECEKHRREAAAGPWPAGALESQLTTAVHLFLGAEKKDKVETKIIRRDKESNKSS